MYPLSFHEASSTSHSPIGSSVVKHGFLELICKHYPSYYQVARITKNAIRTNNDFTRFLLHLPTRGLSWDNKIVGNFGTSLSEKKPEYFCHIHD